MAAPFDLVDLLFYLKGFQIIELGLVGLELGMELVFAGLLRFVPFEQYNSSSFVASGEIVASVIELDGGDNIGFRDVFHISLVAETLCEFPRRGADVAVNHGVESLACSWRDKIWRVR